MSHPVQQLWRSFRGLQGNQQIRQHQETATEELSSVNLYLVITPSSPLQKPSQPTYWNFTFYEQKGWQLTETNIL